MHMSPLLSALLEKRGITDHETFLNPDFVRDTHDPFLLQNMERAVVRILAAIAQGEKIAIYGDFDCDGIPGAALLFDTFRKIGYTNVEVYIPHRDREGYGFHTNAIDTLAEKGVSLIITVDVGTVAFEGCAHARKREIDVIVTDHHEVRDTLPDAIVINPKLPSTGSGQAVYPFKELCGAGVAWKLAAALLTEGRKRELPAFEKIPLGWEKWLLDLVAIATIADLVSLTGENRTLVHFGLTVLRKSPRRGIQALCAAARVRQEYLTEDDIAFSFAPRINAASRMDAPELAFLLLTTDSGEEAQSLAAQLESLNRKRRGAVAAIVREAKARVSARYRPEEKIVVLGDVTWKPSLMGLVANSIMEERGGVACVWGRDGNGVLKGSCRSDGSLSVVELFTSASESFLEFGGHQHSGGFSLSHEAAHTLPEVLLRAGNGLPQRHVHTPESEAEVMLADVSSLFFKELSQLAPFGVGNPKPLFRVRSTRITFARQFGKDMNHTEVTLVCSQSGVSCRAFQFFKTPMDFTLPPSPGTAADILATIERDTFRGTHALALRLVDIVSSRE